MIVHDFGAGYRIPSELARLMDVLEAVRFLQQFSTAILTHIS